jgi:uncharacterized repeat protein (TIGR03803 family)
MKANLQPPISNRLLAVALLTLGMFSAVSLAYSQTFKVLYSFTGGADGGEPFAGLVFDAAGNIYGTTYGGGDTGCFAGCGVVFELTPGSGGWSESTLHSFTGGSDGANPFDSLILDGDGNLYGTTQVGGISCGHTFGCGVAFELSPGSDGWTETALYSFQGGMGGYYPIAGLVFDKKGDLYSTLENGGGTGSPGIVYELSGKDNWNEQILYSFGGNDSGAAPMAAPIFDAKGNLYGTTSCCGGGAVWELAHGTWKEKTLYAFQSGGGDNPEGSLVLDKAGNLYGTTLEGGGKDRKGRGVVFKLAKSGDKWRETVLHVFRGGNDGQFLYGTPVLDKAGNLYGTTEQDGKYGCGTVFKLAPHPGDAWKETILHQFTGGSDGCAPSFEALISDAAGNLYGTASEGGNPGCYDKNGCGVVFEITP